MKFLLGYNMEGGMNLWWWWGWGAWVVKNLVGEIIPGERMSKFSGNLVDD